MASMAKRAAPVKEKDVDYTVPGLLALVAIVLFTALFFAQEGHIPALASTGQAYQATETADTPMNCEPQSWCDGTRLVRQHDDCAQYVAYCQYGCAETDGGAVCN
jgi:hypothetical protein